MSNKPTNNIAKEKFCNLSNNKSVNTKKSNFYKKTRKNLFNIHFINNKKSKTKIFNYRKSNSLSKLTKKFIEIVNEEKSNIINLQTITEKMNISKRRIYDITNAFKGNSIYIYIL